MNSYGPVKIFGPLGAKMTPRIQNLNLNHGRGHPIIDLSFFWTHIMARGINKVILVGNLGNDPEVRYTPAGAAVTTISVATTESWKDKEGNRQEKTEWHRVVFFSRLAEIAGEYLKKGSQVYIEGKLRTNKWQDQNGQDRYTTEILANEMQMLGGRGDSGSGGFGGGQSMPSAPKANKPQQNNNPAPNFDDFDDEIPF